MLYNEHNLAVAKIAARSETQPEISGVFFTKDKTVATDRYRLLEVSVPKEAKKMVEDFPVVPVGGRKKTAMRGFKPFIVPAEFVKKELKVPNASGLPVLNHIALSYVGDEQVEFLSTDLEAGDVKVVRRVEGKFPDYEQAIPKGKPKVEVVLNAKYIKELAEIMGKINPDNDNITIKMWDDQTPVLIEGGSASQKARGVVMPIKI